MITNIFNSGSYLSVSHNPGASPYINPGQPMTGLVRYVSNRLEVYDGSSWQQIGGGSASVSLTGEAIEILDWAREERNRQAQREELIKKNPALQKAWEAVKRAEDNFDTLAALVDEEQPSVT